MLKKITNWETEDGKVFDTQEEAEDYMFEREKEVMTHHTDTELTPCPFCGGKAYFEIDDDRWQWVECGSCGMQGNRSASLMEDCKPKLSEAWNRRAPAVPVPQGWKLVPALEVTACYFPKAGEAELTWERLGEDGKRFGMTVKVTPEQGESLANVVYPCVPWLAATQPPEAAPVELPEPFTTLVRKKSWSTNCYEASPLSKHRDYGRLWADERVNVYTEQQVIDLLKSVGVTVKS